MSALDIRLGLDLGQAQDYSALAVVEHVRMLPPGVTSNMAVRQPWSISKFDMTDHFNVLGLKRWELGTPYTRLADEVVEIMRRPEFEQALMVFDRGGVGRAVGDLFQARQRGPETAPWAYGVTTVSSGGNGVATISKANLYAPLIVAIERGHLHVAGDVLLREDLQKELLGFQQEVTTAGNARIVFDRSGQQGHGDLASALALAVSYNLAKPGRVVEHPDTGGKEEGNE